MTPRTPQYPDVRSGACPDCLTGNWWQAQDGGLIQLCVLHERLVAHVHGWRLCPADPDLFAGKEAS